MVQTPPKSLAAQMTAAAAGLFVVLLAISVAFGWWAVVRIDERQIARQTRSVHTGFSEILDSIPVNQDSSAIWDDAVLHARAADQEWLAENLVEWLGEYYHYDRVYLLGPDGTVVRASASGAASPAAVYDQERPVIDPLVSKLRSAMADASAGLSESTKAVTGMGELDVVSLPDGTPAIVSVRPILPSSDRVTQAPGTEFLLVSVVNINKNVLGRIAEKFDLRDLSFSEQSLVAAGQASTPVLSKSGRIIGFFTFVPDRPAWEFVASVGPAALLGLLVALGCVGVLLTRLRRTSTQLEASEANAKFLAFHDPLTGIPNRALFEDRLEPAILGTRQPGGLVALHYIDLDRFKHVNDTLGHPAGDTLIREVSARLASVVRASDTLARLGGDEFAVVQVGVENVVDVEVLCERMIAILSLPYDLDGHEARVTASVGVVLASDPHATSVDLMRRADIALYQAKANGRGRFMLFAGDMDEAIAERRQLEQDLRRALNGGSGLTLVYQPIHHAVTNQLLGAEALVRWDHPTRGPLLPEHFIDLAEERGLIDMLGAFVLRTACQFAARTQIPWVAVNVSPLQFRDEHFAERVLATIEHYGLPPSRLEIEITEGLLLQNSPTVRNTLARLRAAGIRIALDDFGTGYSSISYLRRYGVDKLKIDKSFVEQLGQGSDIDSIVLSITHLARAMRMEVTAEGVETETQRQLLIDMKCDQLQGYLLAMPVPAEQLIASLPAARRRAA